MADDDGMTFELLDARGQPAPEPTPPESTPPPAGPKRSRLGLGLLAVALLAVAAVVGLLITPDPDTPARTLDPAPPAGLAATRFGRSGFDGAVGGSLAVDHGQVTALRARVVDVFTDTGGLAVGAKDVILLWAGDLGGHRYAVALVPHEDGRYVPVVLTGAAGSSAKQMSLGWQRERSEGAGLPIVPVAVFLRPATGARNAAVFVIAPHAPGVEIATARRFLPDGRSITNWRPLRRSGAVWAGPATAGEQYLATYRIPAGPTGTATTADSVGGPDVRAAAQTGATGRAAGTTDGRPAVGCSADAARSVGPSLAERSVLVSATPWGTDHVLAVTLLRSPENGWVWGMCDTRVTRSDGSIQSSVDSSGSGVTRSPWPTADDVMAAFQATPGQYVVLAPAGAERIRTRGGSTAPVRDRLARIEGPRDQTVTFEALDHGGRVVGRLEFDPTAPSTATG